MEKGPKPIKPKCRPGTEREKNLLIRAIDDGDEALKAMMDSEDEDMIIIEQPVEGKIITDEGAEVTIVSFDK